MAPKELLCQSSILDFDALTESCGDRSTNDLPSLVRCFFCTRFFQNLKCPHSTVYASRPHTPIAIPCESYRSINPLRLSPSTELPSKRREKPKCVYLFPCGKSSFMQEGKDKVEGLVSEPLDGQRLLA